MGICIGKSSCPECASSDAVQVFEQEDKSRDAFCFACDTKFYNVEGLTVLPNHANRRESINNRIEMHDVLELPSLPLPDRGIRQETCEAFGVRMGLDAADRSTIASHFYPYHDVHKNLIGYKQRIVADKSFFKVGVTKGAALFGMHICPINKKLFVTEGELDALALYQALKDTNPPKWKDSIPSVVSITSGASGAAKQLLENMDFLKRFQEIVLVFDSDQPGRESAEKVAKALECKVLIAHLPRKDACEMVANGEITQLRTSVMRDAQAFQPDGIINAREGWERYKERKSVECHPYPSQFGELNKKTYGWRFGSVITVTSGSGMGKTQFLREVEYDILMNTDFKIADIHLEEDIGDTIEGLMALHLNKRIHLPDVEVTEEEEARAFEEVFGSGRVEMYDHFGGMSDDDLFSRIRYFNQYLDCRVFVLDHLSIIISETADEGDERRRIDTVMTKLAKLAKELDIVIFLVVHLKKAGQGKSFEEGHVPTSDDLRGSASLKQLSWDIIALSRNQQEKDDVRRNTSGLHILKCRFSGKTGEAGYTYFDDRTGRLIEGQPPTDSDEFDEEKF